MFVILDLGLPDMDGQEVLSKLRHWLTAPILILSVRNQDAQKIAALDHGTDGSLEKVSRCPGELLAQRFGLLCTRGKSDGNWWSYESGDLKVDFAAWRVYVKDAEIHLTRIEYKLLTTLAFAMSAKSSPINFFWRKYGDQSRLRNFSIYESSWPACDEKSKWTQLSRAIWLLNKVLDIALWASRFRASNCFKSA